MSKFGAMLKAAGRWGLKRDLPVMYEGHDPRARSSRPCPRYVDDVGGCLTCGWLPLDHTRALRRVHQVLAEEETVAHVRRAVAGVERAEG